jgi:hypothetical protein
MVIELVQQAGGEPVTYNLRMAKVGVGSRANDPGAKYVTDVQGDETSIAEGGTQKLVFEVRDRFNNPVSGVDVDAEIEKHANPPTDSLSTKTATTDGDGRASVVYQAPDNVNEKQEVKVTVKFGPSKQQKATFNIDVMDSDGGRTNLGSPNILLFRDDPTEANQNAIQPQWTITDSEGNLKDATVFVFDKQGDRVVQCTEEADSGTTWSDRMAIRDLSAGTYSITLLARDEDGNTDVQQQTVVEVVGTSLGTGNCIQDPGN